MFFVTSPKRVVLPIERAIVTQLSLWVTTSSLQCTLTGALEKQNYPVGITLFIHPCSIAVKITEINYLFKSLL